jgi:hypothetical protein
MDSVTSSTTWGGNTVAGTENLGAAPPELPLGDRVQFLVQGREQRRSRRWITGFRGADQLADRGAGSRRQAHWSLLPGAVASVAPAGHEFIVP